MNTLITVLSQAMDAERRKFSGGEQKFLLDIFNGTFLTPALMGQHLHIQAVDAMEDMPGEYEKKWGIDNTIFEKINGLNLLQTALIELWAAAFWDGAGKYDLNAYVTGRDNVQLRLSAIVNSLTDIAKKLDKTKSSFKSASIASARADIEKIIEMLQ